MPIVYLHGMPGGPAELEVLGGPAVGRFFVPDRRANVSFDALAAAVAERYAGQTVRLVAFSLGARPALEIAARLGGQVSHIDLIAPAAPLTAQDRNMAGYPVFLAARRYPGLFVVLVRLQAFMAWRMPGFFYTALFRSARGADLSLSRDAAFRAIMPRVLSHCFADNGRAYRAEIAAYVAPWTQLIAHVAQPVTLWHGTVDNWAPVGMSERLAVDLPNVAAYHRCEGLSHYSVLKVALEEITGRATAGQGVGRA